MNTSFANSHREFWLYLLSLLRHFPEPPPTPNCQLSAGASMTGATGSFYYFLSSEHFLLRQLQMKATSRHIKVARLCLANFSERQKSLHHAGLFAGSET